MRRRACRCATDGTDRSIEGCSRKCIPTGSKESNELNKGESVCVKRCVEKFFTVLEVVGTELNELGMASAGVTQ